MVSLLVYLGALFFVYRTRLYFAWIMGECVCMSVGLGAYPAISRPTVGEGPTDLAALDRWVIFSSVVIFSSQSPAKLFAIKIKMP